MFNAAFTHISERIDQVYKDLTKGKAAPMGGVAYLSLEDNEVRSCRPATEAVVDDYFFGRNRTMAVSSITQCLL